MFPLHPIPVPPNTATPGSHGAYFTHTTVLTWADTQLGELASLAIDHFGNVRVIQSESADELALILTLDVQGENHDALANQYFNSVAKVSTLEGATQSITTVASTCTETELADGSLQITGVCIRDLVIALPRTRSLPLSVAFQGSFSASSVELSRLNLSVRAASRSELTDVKGQVFVRGGAADAVVIANRMTGGFSADLSQISEMKLSRISGSVSLSLADPAGSNVSLDDSVIQSFPFSRP